MLQQNGVFKLVFSAVLSAITVYLGGFDTILKVLIIMSVIDFATGIMSGAISKKISSEIGFKGIARKICIYILVGLANALDRYLNTAPMLRSAMAGFYIANEGLSVLENIGKTGLPLPSFIVNMLAQLKKDKEKEWK